MDKETEDIKRALLKKRGKTIIPQRDLLNSGSTLLNLECSGKTTGAFAKGHYVLVVGDSSSGKTFLTMTWFAEASINPNFDEYRFIADMPENGALMDVEKFYGKRLAGRLEPPKGTKEDPGYSSTTTEFYDNVDAAFEEGKPFIYLLDSMDALSSDEDEKFLDKAKKAKGTKEKEAGTYGTGRAKSNSGRLRRIANRLRKFGCILVIITQTRQNIGFTSKFEPKTRAGGHALKFFAHMEFWTSVKGKIKRQLSAKKVRTVGVYSLVKIKKNRISGRERSVIIPIYYTAGIDDTGANVSYLIEEGHWKKTKGQVNAPEFDFTGTEEELIGEIESKGLEKKLRGIVQMVWTIVEVKSTVVRKNRYD